MTCIRRCLSFFVLSTLAALLTACDQATNQTFVGPPLATLKGTMTAREGLIITQPVRLAIAWFAFSQTGLPASQPQGVVTDEISYTGTFPQNFTFALTGLPPQEAITTDSSQITGAIGVLLAYEDLNGDGQLTLAGTGPVVDRVLGSSASALAHLLNASAYSQRYVAYVEALLPNAPVGATTGYNLVSNEPVDGGPAQTWRSLTTSQLSLELIDDPALNLLACEEFYTRILSGTLGGSACGIAMDSGSSALVTASIQFSGTTGIAVVSLGGLGPDGGFTPAAGAQDAGVTVNGHPLAWNGINFTLYEPTRAVLVDGPNVVRVDRPGGPVWQESGVVPAPFTVTAPATAAVNSSFTVSWVPGDGSLFWAYAGSQFPMVSNNAVQLTARAQPGPMSVTVLALNPVVPAPRVSCSRSVSVDVTVVP